MLRGEVKEGVELLLPPGMSAVPLGDDVLLFGVDCRRDWSMIRARASRT